MLIPLPERQDPGTVPLLPIFRNGTSYLLLSRTVSNRKAVRVPRALKVFKTHIGFHDLIVAAPSMKAAAAAWEASPRLFAQGFAAQTHEPDAVKAALARPGVVLRRPGQAGAYKAQPDKPAAPKVTARQKQKAAQAEAARRRKEEKEKRAQEAAEKRAKKAAEDELAEIEQEEARLRERRQALQKKFHLRSV